MTFPVSLRSVRSQCDTGLKRVMVISDAAPHRNGVGAYYQDLGHHLREKVAAIDIVSPQIVDGRWRGGWTMPLPGDATQKFCVPNVLGLRRRVEAFAPDVVVVPTPGPFGLFGAIYGRYCRARVVAGFHTWYEKLSQLYWNFVQGGLTRGLFEVSNRLIFRLADTVLANSDDMLAIAGHMGARNTTLMGTPVDPLFLEPPSRATSSLDTVLFAGRLAAEKNIDSLLRATAALPHIRFAVAGDGPLRERVQTAAGRLPNLDYLGWLDRPALRAAIDHHDALVLPSVVESFGTVALEAMARQRLVLVTRDCGITRWPDLAAHLVVMEKGDGLVPALHSLRARSEFELSALAHRARQAAERHNAWNIECWLRVVDAPR